MIALATSGSNSARENRKMINKLYIKRKNKCKRSKNALNLWLLFEAVTVGIEVAIDFVCN